jgi:hypothetical protein
MKAVELGVQLDAQSTTELLEGSSVFCRHMLGLGKGFSEPWRGIREVSDWGGSENQHVMQTSIYL